MNKFGFFFSILIPTGLGFTIIQILFRRHHLQKLYAVALGYGLGLGLLAQYMFILGIFNIPYTVWSAGLPLSVTLVILVLYNLKISKNTPKLNLSSNLQNNAKAINPSWGRVKKRLLSRSALKSIKCDAVCICLIIFIIYQVLYVFWRGINIPIFSWDAISTVAFKSKIIYYESTIKNMANFPHAAYPLHIPLIQVWIALNNQMWSDILIKFIFPLTYLSLIIITYYSLTLFTNKRWALIGVSLLISSNLLTFHATISYRDLFLMYYTCVCSILLLIWAKYQYYQFIILAALFAGFATFVKLEGIFYLAIHATVLCFIVMKQTESGFNHKIKTLTLFAIPSLGIALIFQIYRLLIKIPLEEKTKLDLGWHQLSRLPQVLIRYYEDLFLTGNWGLVWILLGLSLMNVQKIRKNLPAQILLLALFLHFSLISSISMFTASFIWISGTLSDTGLSRLILHFFPIAVMLIIFINSPGAADHNLE